MSPEPSEDVQELLATIEAMDGPEIHELTPEEAREYRASLIEGREPVEDVGSVEDRTIPGPEGELPVRVYTPDTEGPHPVIAFFHGGGFVLGTLESYDDACRILTNLANAVVVSVDYRLAPEHRFPAAVEDCYAATEWLAEHAGELGGDPDRLAIAGDSAGGNLAAAVTLAARDRDGPEVVHQALVYPVTDHRTVDHTAVDYPSREENAEGYFLTEESIAWFDGHYVDSWADRPNPLLSPVAAESHADLPPASVVTCEFDPLRDEGIAYAEALDADGTPVTRHHFDDQIHGVMTMVNHPFDVQGGHDILFAVGTDLRAALH